MKADKILTAAIAFVLAMVLCLGAVGCLVTAFDLQLESLGNVFFRCGLASLFCAVVFSFPKGYLPAAVAGAALLGYHWRLGKLGKALLQLIYRISHVYNQAYHWGVLQLVDTPWNAGTADLPMIALGILLAAAVTWTVCRGKGASLPVCLSLLPLLLCVVVTDTVPSALFLYLLVLGQLLLLLTSFSRREHQGNRMTLYVTLPVALALGGLFLAMPKEGYVSHADALREEMASWFQRLPQQTAEALESMKVTFQTAGLEEVNLAALGRRRDTKTEIMAVAAETGGTLYLRGQDYDLYDGASWRSSPNRVESFGCQGESLGYVVVQTKQEADLLYLPYYPRDPMSLIGGRYENLRIAKEYSFLRYGSPETWQEKPFVPDGDGRYLTLPENTKAAARELLAPILEGKTTRRETAQAIGDYVRQSALYDRNTDPMGTESGDFALWFLREGKTGYCVHFATAATVLLRAAGIQARYVSGYMKPVRAGETEVFTDENAHAWAEYYVPELEAWVILEATPPDGLPSGTEETEETQETQMPPETLPPTTEAPTQSPTQPAPTVPPTEGSPEVTATVPAQEAPEEESPPPAWIGQVLTLLLTLALAGGVLEGQRVLRIYLRHREGSDPNRLALRMWRETERIGKLLREAPPEELEGLALKAKFSQHTLTGEELNAFTLWLNQKKALLKGKPVWLRILYRYVFAEI